MKTKLLTLAFILCAAAALRAQINVGTESTSLSAGKIEETDLKRLQSATLVIVTYDKLKFNAALPAFKKSWTYCPLVIADTTEANTYRGQEQYAFLEEQGYTINTSNGSNTHYYWALYMNWAVEEKGKTRWNSRRFCRFELSPYYEDRGMGFRNDDIGYLNVYLKFANACLEKKQMHWLFQEHADKDRLGELKNATLYVPEYLLNKYYENEKYTEQELMKKYPYSYEIVTADKLNELISNPGRDLYFVQYVQSSTDKFITVFNAYTGDILYSNYKSLSAMIRPKDIGKLASHIK